MQTQKTNFDLHDRIFEEDRLYDLVKNTAEAKGLTETGQALLLMKQYHQGQFRKGKDQVPYIIHPLTMAGHALAMGIEEDDLLAAILLHDVAEDCGVTAEELEVNGRVQEAVSLLTFVKPAGLDRKEAKAQYFSRLSENRIAAVVKILDRCSNLSTMATGFSREKMISYIEETENLVFPVLEKVKKTWPEFAGEMFLAEYQMKSVMESLKRLL